jgi:hypothetical protein
MCLTKENKMPEYTVPKGSVFEKAAAKKPPEKTLGVLIDGSGSMTMKPADGAAPLTLALEAVLGLSQSGPQVTADVWSCPPISPVDIKSEADIQLLEKRAPGGVADFALVTNYLQARAASAPDNFVVVSDGDFFARKGWLRKLLAEMEKRPGTSIDFVIVNSDANTPMAQLARTLRREVGDQITFRIVADGNVAGALIDIAAERGIGQPAVPAHRATERRSIPKL